MEIGVKNLYYKFRNIILYGIIGGFTSSLDFCIFTILSNVIGCYYIYANCISVIIGISISFLLNRAYNFKIKDHTRRRFAIFLTVGLYGLLLSNLILYMGIDVFMINKIIVKMLSVILVVGFQFMLNKLVTFKK